jgi:acetyl esterase/lipase
MGDSAGGGLTLALLLKLRDEQEGLPAGAVVLSPWTDLALTGASIASNAPFDMMLDAAEVPRFADNYLAGHDPRDPYASPLYGNPSGLPPTIFFVGAEEILRDDSIRMAENMRSAGCQVELRMQEKMPHVWPAFAPILPEARFAIAEIGRFVRRLLEKPSI